MFGFFLTLEHAFGYRSIEHLFGYEMKASQ